MWGGGSEMEGDRKEQGRVSAGKEVAANCLECVVDIDLMRDVS